MLTAHVRDFVLETEQDAEGFICTIIEEEMILEAVGPYPTETRAMQAGRRRVLSYYNDYAAD